MGSRTVAVAYGYTVCLGALVLVAYALLTAEVPPGEMARRLRPVEVEVLSTDTMALFGATETTLADQTSDPLDAIFERRALQVSKESFERARKQLEEERAALARASDHSQLIKRTIIALFALAVFALHWRWLNRLSRATSVSGDEASASKPVV